MGGIVLSLGGLASAYAQPAQTPDLTGGAGGWIHPFGTNMGRAVPGSPPIVSQDPGHPFGGAGGAGYRIGNLSNANLMPWVKDIMKKDTDEIDAGKIAFQSSAACVPAGVPLVLSYPNPLKIVQAPDKVVMIKEQGAEIRHIYLNVPHSANPKPSWFGESVGHYEGDTLVIDTIGFNAKTVLDVYRTPHSEKLHVVERWRTVDGGKELEVTLTVDDPGSYYKPWTTRWRDQRSEEPFLEMICQENNLNFGLFDFPMPVATKPDF
jgi:hypothetical protein